MAISPRQADPGAGARRIFIVVALAVLLPLAWLGTLDGWAGRYVETGLKRALATFATARAANAVISALQGTSVDVTPLGVGVIATPGQILDPLNDLVEEFSTLMLAACVSFGIQALLMAVGASWGVSLAVTMLLLAWAVLAWRTAPLPRLLVRLLVIALFVRFAPAVAALGSEGAFRAVMAGTYSSSQSRVEHTYRSIVEVEDEVGVQSGKTLLERMRNWISSKGNDVVAKLRALKETAEAVVRDVVTLMAIFAVQTVLLPLLFLWVVYRAFNAALGWRPGGPAP